MSEINKNIPFQKNLNGFEHNQYDFFPLHSFRIIITRMSDMDEKVFFNLQKKVGLELNQFAIEVLCMDNNFATE